MIRLDVFLTEKGYFTSRSKAVGAIKAGQVLVDGISAEKPSLLVEEPVITLLGDTPPVSRAFAKLAAALDDFELDPTGKVVVDIGASTGGFTQCLLERGAEVVYAIDIGTNQLDPTLREDPRVRVMEQTDGRTLVSADFDLPIDWVVMDVSFISQTKIYPAIARILKENGCLISLVKPQFEAGREFVGKNGVVRDPKGKVKGHVLETLTTSAWEHGLRFVDCIDSPITGKDGNLEYLALFIKE